MRFLSARSFLSAALLFSSASAVVVVGQTNQASAAEDRYALAVVAPPTAKVGAASVVKVQIKATAPWHINQDFPTSLKLDAATGLAVEKAALKKSDAASFGENEFAFDVKVTPQAAGKQEVKGKLKFAVCKEEACSPVTADVVIVVSAAAAK